MNINPDIQEYVKENARSLEYIGTGGGIDYFGRWLDDGRCAIVCCQDDAGSPDDLDDGADLIIWQDVNWESWIRFSFGTAKEAYDALHSMEEGEV